MRQHSATTTIGGTGLALLLAACGASNRSDGTRSHASGPDGGMSGAVTAATGSGAGGTTGISGTPGGGGTSSANGGTSGAGRAAAPSGGGGGDLPGAAGSGGLPADGGTAGTSGGTAGGTAGSAGSAAGGGIPLTLPSLVTSAPDAYWKTDGVFTETTASADVTVVETQVGQTWVGFGGAFNELGWSYLTSTEMVNAAAKLLFSATDGAAFAWGRIPIGASNYATSRYTLDDTGADVAPLADDSNRPAPDLTLGMFSLTRDREFLIPSIKAAQAVKPDLRFWASPWTPPVWMKTGYRASSNADPDKAAAMPSYYDGGSMKSDAETLGAYAEYFSNFVQGYRDEGIDIRVVAPQEEPNFEENYPSCLWDKLTYTTFVREYLGPAMKSLGVEVMLGTLSDSSGKDLDLAKAVLADSTATSFLGVIGAQWNALDQSKLSALGSSLPVWATEHRGGNYPWLGDYVSAGAPNDQAYAVESWTLIRDAITKVHVTAYNAWNMVLDPYGWSIDTSVEWAQDALLVADAGTVTPTPAYYVFRHLSQYVAPGATVVGTSGGDAVAFKNPDGSLVAVMYNSGAANDGYVVALGGKKLAFAMPGNGWATVLARP